MDVLAILVGLMQTRPGMAMGGTDHPLYRLQSFLCGLRWAHDICPNDKMENVHLLMAYEDWMTMQLSGSDNRVAWFHILLKKHCGDEHQAVIDFFKDWEIYLAGTGKSTLPTKINANE